MSIDIIGPLFDPPQIVGGDPIQLEGWHVNVTPEVLEAHPALSAYLVEPSPLRRVWSGDDPASPVLTVALRFDDEAAWNGVLEGLV